MSAVATAIVGSAIIGGAASKSAAKAQAKASNKATALQREQFETQREDQKPYREAGYSALDRLREMLALGGDKTAQGYGSLTQPFTGQDIQAEPGYQFGLREGERAMQRNASAAGRNLSGATLKALQRYNVDYAGTKYTDAFNRNQVSQNALFNRLSGISGTGQNATNQVGQAGQNFANNASANIIGAGNVGAGNALRQGNIMADGLSQLGALWNRPPTSSVSQVALSNANASADPMGTLIQSQGW